MLALSQRYPPSVLQHFATLADMIQGIVQPHAIMLLGSAARGELSYRIAPSGQLELFSDYELLVVTDRSVEAPKRQLLAREVARLEAEIANPNPLFHIDLLLRERRRLPNMPHLIFNYEMKQNAALLAGVDIRSQLPEVSLDNLDMGNTNEILFKRLWAILLHLPRRFVLGEPTAAERRVTGYVLCRNLLDIPTVLMPHAGLLLPTYGDRVAALTAAYAELAFSTELGRSFPSLSQHCLARRVDLNFDETDLVSLYEDTVDALEHALQWLGGDAPFRPEMGRELFNEWPISRGEWYNLARLLPRYLQRRGPTFTWRWLNQPRKGWLTIGLLATHRALLAWQRGEKRVAAAAMHRSETALAKLSHVQPALPESPFPERWLALRAAWGELWREYIRLGEGKYRARFTRITEWEDG